MARWNCRSSFSAGTSRRMPQGHCNLFQPILIIVLRRTNLGDVAKETTPRGLLTGRQGGRLVVKGSGRTQVLGIRTALSIQDSGLGLDEIEVFQW